MTGTEREVQQPTCRRGAAVVAPEIAFRMACRVLRTGAILRRMKSPERGGLWDTIEDAERRAVVDFIAPAGRVPSPGRGDDGTGQPANPWCKPRRGKVVVTAEVAQRIRARATVGQSLSAICAAEHLDPRE